MQRVNGGTVRARISVFLVAILALTGLAMVSSPATGAETYSISGTVTLPSGADPDLLSHVFVMAGEAGYAEVDPVTGQYTIEGVPPGAYLVGFQAPGANGALVSQYYDGTPDFAEGTPVVVSNADLTGIDAHLELANSVRGTVARPAGSASDWYRGLRVRAVNVDSNNASEVELASDGNYNLLGLPAGDWVLSVEVIDPRLEGAAEVGAGLNYRTVWYGGGTQRENATVLSLSGGQKVTGVDMTPVPGAVIAGRLDGVRETARIGLADLSGRIFDYCFILTEPDGLTCNGLAPGTYRLLYDVVEDGQPSMYQLKTTDGQAYFTVSNGEIFDGQNFEVHGLDWGFVPDLYTMVDISYDPQSPRFSAFFDEISWFAQREITTGYSNGDGTNDYRPFGKVTRDAMAAFLYRYAGSPDVDLPDESPFVDVTPSSSAFYKEIVWLAQTGISTGWETSAGNEFRPFNTITRDAMAAFLYRFAEEPDWTAPGTSPFADVKPSQSFYDEITWLADTGITTGWTVGSTKEFRPYDSITRDAMAAFVYRFDGLPQ